MNSCFKWSGAKFPPRKPDWAPQHIDTARAMRRGRIAANIAKLPESGLILISLKAAFHRWDNFLRFDQFFQIEEIRDVVVFVERRDYVVERIHYALFAICSDFRMAFSSI